MKKVIATGRTIEDAIQIALSKLEVTRDQVEIIILTQPSRGLFGLIGSRDAEIEAIVRGDLFADEEEEGFQSDSEFDFDEPEAGDPIAAAVEFLQETVQAMGLSVTVNVQEETDGYVMFQIEGDRLGILIGRRGQTLDALQYLVNLVANKQSKAFLRIILDAEGYRSRRKETLERLADKLARQVIRERKSVELEAMPAHERKVIHTYLQGHARVGTRSEGTDPNRRIVIYLK